MSWKKQMILIQLFANDEDASGGDGLLAIETDDIDIDTGGKNDLLTIVQTPDDLQTTFDACRALKVERLGGIRHLGGQLNDDILAMARQKALDTLDVLGIVCREIAPTHAPGPRPTW